MDVVLKATLVLAAAAAMTHSLLHSKCTMFRVWPTSCATTFPIEARAPEAGGEAVSEAIAQPSWVQEAPTNASPRVRAFPAAGSTKICEVIKTAASIRPNAASPNSGLAKLAQKLRNNGSGWLVWRIFPVTPTR